MIDAIVRACGGLIGILFTIFGGILALVAFRDFLTLGSVEAIAVSAFGAGLCLGGVLILRSVVRTPKKPQKQCPACKELIHPEARRCPRCTEVIGL